MLCTRCLPLLLAVLIDVLTLQVLEVLLRPFVSVVVLTAHFACRLLSQSLWGVSPDHDPMNLARIVASALALLVNCLVAATRSW